MIPSLRTTARLARHLCLVELKKGLESEQNESLVYPPVILKNYSWLDIILGNGSYKEVLAVHFSSEPEKYGVVVTVGEEERGAKCWKSG
mmetsp:Transcript_43204/g.69606  ORF Transcript_43204/g.69606 Transcript_43204/m.69606 type:complete len:89 (-) Transcript_43204:923-1189(-)